MNKRYLKPVKNKSNKFYVTLCKDMKKENFYIHRIVADHYLPNKPYAKSAVIHLNKDKADNGIDNLAWDNSTQQSIKVRKINNQLNS